MKYRNLLILVLVSAATSFTVAQPVKKFPAPVKAKVKGFAEAYCVALDARSRVCKGNPSSEEALGGEFVLERSGKEINRWEAEIGSTTSAQNFEVLQSDLDANGTRELIVVDFMGSSMGMGVNSHRIHIFENDESKPPLDLSVEEYGAFGSFVRQPGFSGVLILATEWLYSDKIDPQLPSGLYLIGRWFRYANGALEEVNKPILARRFLSSFARERGRTVLTPSIPYSWFANGKGRELKADPEAMEKVAASNAGTIIAVQEYKFKVDASDPESRMQAVPLYIIKLDSGGEVSYTSHQFEEPQVRPEQIKSFNKFGLGATKVVLPMGADIESFYPNLVGVRVEIVSHQPGAEAESTTILWLQGRK